MTYVKLLCLRALLCISFEPDSAREISDVFVRFEVLTAVVLMKATCSFETSVEFQLNTRRYILEDRIF
jgi:hypothetical protein